MSSAVAASGSNIYDDTRRQIIAALTTLLKAGVARRNRSLRRRCERWLTRARTFAMHAPGQVEHSRGACAAATRSGRATLAQLSTSPTAPMVEGSYQSLRTIVRCAGQCSGMSLELSADFDEAERGGPASGPSPRTSNVESLDSDQTVCLADDVTRDDLAERDLGRIRQNLLELLVPHPGGCDATRS